ncbi:hypothetical protein BHM03_00023250 [Ensete ventricosum]|nr:hypothetical protein BHM03_00023250 [Ensete ventricosum]
MYGSIFSSTFSNIIELLEIQLLTFGLNVFIYVFVCVTSKGIKVEGILRQSADVEEVKRRVREYEQGMFAFIVYNTISYHSVCSVCTSPIEDQYARYLSLPCVGMLGTDRGRRVNNIRSAIYKTFPEPNRRLVQRYISYT